jgi:hypothetical protein
MMESRDNPMTRCNVRFLRVGDGIHHGSRHDVRPRAGWAFSTAHVLSPDPSALVLWTDCSMSSLPMTTITPLLPFYTPHRHTSQLYNEERKQFIFLHVTRHHGNLPNAVVFHIGVGIGKCTRYLTDFVVSQVWAVYFYCFMIAWVSKRLIL